MEIVVAQAAKRVGESFAFEWSHRPAQQSFGGRVVRFEAPLHVKGSYVFDGGAFTVEARADTVLASVCGRCGQPFSEPFAFSMTERFVREDAEDGETYPYAGDRLDLSQAIMDNLFLNLPIVSLCRPDCRGLCPVCGGDRNSRPCACDSRAAENPFSALSGLKDELKEV
ncbi:MAG: DUF177 domain-containing protein [Clostridia bacterium]|nr:DUF177 domain-containing protein [Clostridia bacterium]